MTSCPLHSVYTLQPVGTTALAQPVVKCIRSYSRLYNRVVSTNNHRRPMRDVTPASYRSASQHGRKKLLDSGRVRKTYWDRSKFSSSMENGPRIDYGKRGPRFTAWKAVARLTKGDRGELEFSSVYRNRWMLLVTAQSHLVTHLVWPHGDSISMRPRALRTMHNPWKKPSLFF